MASITPLFDNARTTYLWGAKGGVGTSTVAALHALALARAGHPTTLVAADGDHGELAAIVGMPEGLGPVDANAAAGVVAGERARVVVVDGGCDPALDRAVSRRLVVVRLCYLALRRALAAGMGGPGPR
jgi:Mrp family chromosome partitioning ATPase